MKKIIDFLTLFEKAGLGIEQFLQLDTKTQETLAANLVAGVKAALSASGAEGGDGNTVIMKPSATLTEWKVAESFTHPPGMRNHVMSTWPTLERVEGGTILRLYAPGDQVPEAARLATAAELLAFAFYAKPSGSFGGALGTVEGPLRLTMKMRKKGASVDWLGDHCSPGNNIPLLYAVRE